MFRRKECGSYYRLSKAHERGAFLFGRIDAMRNIPSCYALGTKIPFLPVLILNGGAHETVRPRDSCSKSKFRS